MTQPAHSRTRPAAALLPLATAVLGAGIFTIDTVTRTDIVVAALYAGVVLMATRFCPPRRVAATAAGCVALTIVSHLLSRPSGPVAEGELNLMISLAVIGFTTALAVRSRSSELMLRESEEQWKAVFEQNPTMFFIVDGAGATLSVNPFGAAQLGFTVEELVGQPVENLFLAEDREAAMRNATACLREPGRAASWELRKVRKDGAVIWVRETARAMLFRNRPVVLIVCEDITERKQAEYLTGHVFEISPDGMCIIGRDYSYQRVNSGYERLTTRRAEEVVGRQVPEILGRDVFEQISRPCLERCFAGEDVKNTGWVAYPVGRRYVAISYSPLRPYSERVEAALVITRDLTDHVRASEALRTAQAELAHVNRVATMGQLTASIAHEVSQPVAAAVMNAKAAQRWLDSDPPNLDEVRLALGRIVDNGGRVNQVIGRIRAAVKKAPPRRTRFDPNEAVRDVIALTRSEAEKHGVAVEARLAADLPPVEGDRVQVQQVILNLIINAIEAMSGAEGGPRELRLSTEADPERAVKVTVRDSGPGLDPQTVERLFEAFYTTKLEGMGMGLAICRSIVEAHGGRLWASANEPRGAVFQFALPAEGAETATLRRAGEAPR